VEVLQTLAFYDLLHQLSSWTIANGVDAATANQYIAGLFQALSFAAQQDLQDCFR
jgi:hypothetical protein